MRPAHERSALSRWFPRARKVLGLLACSLVVWSGAAFAAADQIHWTIIGQTAVTFDWRGSSNTISYGTTTAYGTTVTAVTPSPLPWSSAGPFWESRLTGLTENTLYHYSIDGGPDHTFRTPPPRGSTAGFTAYAQGDIGDSTNYSRVGACQTLVAQGAPKLVLMVGDLTYGNANGIDAVDKHFNDVMKWSQDAAYMPAWGNHEWDDAPNDDLQNYKGRFDLPNPAASTGAPAPGCCGEDWSWFDYGNVRFIAYPEPYTSATWPSWQTAVIPIMNAAQADPLIRYIVTIGHRPAYSSGHHPGEVEIKNVLDALGDSYSKYVLNVNGHSHNYERSHPQHGVVHLTTGIGGSTLEEDGPCLWLECTQPSWSAFRAMHHGVVRLIFGSTSIVIEAVCGPPGDSGANQNDITCTSGSVFDRYVIGIEADSPPVVTAPAIATARPGQLKTVNVTAVDPNGDAITSLTMDASALPVPNNAAFTPGPGNTTGTFTWTPTAAHLGTWDVSFRAANALTGPWATTSITVSNTDHPPAVVAAPSDQTILVLSEAVVNVTASDPDDDPISSLTANTGSLPPGNGSTFVTGAGNTTGTFRWTPTVADTGDYQVTFTATNALTGSASSWIHVLLTAYGPNLCGNPSFETSTSGWSGYQGSTLARVLGSAHHGSYFVRVTGPTPLQGNDGLNDSPSWVQGTVAGKRYRFSAWVRSPTTTGPSRLQLREYLSGVQVGSTIRTPPVALTPTWQEIAGELVAGATGSILDFQVMSTPVATGEEFEIDDIKIQEISGPVDAPYGENLDFAPFVRPNPATREAILIFALSKPGALRVRVYDPSGRLIRRVRDEAYAAAGRHSMDVAGPDRNGRALDPGIYFYRIDAIQGTRAGRFAIVR